MPKLLTTIEEFIATDIQRQGYWMVFNRGYNDVFAFKTPLKSHEDGLPCFPDEADTDTVAREGFLSFMATHFPEIPLVEVFDSMPLSYLAWPYLGSIAIDMQPGFRVYEVLSERYNDPQKDPVRNNAVLWTMDLGTAQSRHAKRIRQSEID